MQHVVDRVVDARVHRPADVVVRIDRWHLGLNAREIARQGGCLRTKLLVDMRQLAMIGRCGSVRLAVLVVVRDTVCFEVVDAAGVARNVWFAMIGKKKYLMKTKSWLEIER